MRAIVLESFDSSPALREVPTPQIAPNEVLVRVRASCLHPYSVSNTSKRMR